MGLYGEHPAGDGGGGGGEDGGVWLVRAIHHAMRTAIYNHYDFWPACCKNIQKSSIQTI